MYSCLYNNLISDTKIVSEVKSVMRPLPSLPITSGSKHFSSSSGLRIERRQQRRRKTKSLKTIVHKPSKNVSFQKKLVVFKYMGKNSSSFTRKESHILVRGLLPEINVDSSEVYIV